MSEIPDEPISLPVIDASWFGETLSRIGDLVCAVDRNALIVWVNPAGERIMGVDRASVVGRSCLEFVHPDDLDRAAESLAYGTQSQRVEVPINFRLRTPDGWRVFEVRGHGLGTDRRGETSLIVARESEVLDELDTLLDAMTGGATETLVNTLVARQAVRSLWGNQVAVLVWRDGDRVEVAHTGIGAELVALLDRPGDWPWTRARRTRAGAGGLLSFLSDQLAEAAAACGFEAVHAIPVHDPLTNLDACLVSFGPAWLRPNLGYGQALQRCGRLLRIAEQQRHQREQLERSARSDPLTGIANRRRLLHQLEDMLLEHDQGKLRTLCLVYGDLDDFKPVNDSHGHAAGDFVLRVVAQRLAEVAGSQGVAARLGGDEFAVVAEGDPAALVDAIRAATRAPIELPGGIQVTVSMSLGAAAATIGISAAALLEAADRSCYADKRSRDEEPG